MVEILRSIESIQFNSIQLAQIDGAKCEAVVGTSFSPSATICTTKHKIFVLLCFIKKRWEKWINYATNALISSVCNSHESQKCALSLSLCECVDVVFVAHFLLKWIKTEKSLIATSVLNFIKIERDIFHALHKECYVELGANRFFSFSFWQSQQASRRQWVWELRGAKNTNEFTLQIVMNKTRTRMV